TVEGGWTSLQTFSNFPNINASDSEVKCVDLTGDGLADILICGNQIHSWYPFYGQQGYGPNQMMTQPFDEIKGPSFVSSNQKEAMYLADMSGDGLQDILRIRNGDVCYWPNIGYGR